MKKYLFTLAAMLFCMTTGVMADKDIIFIKNEPPTNPHSPQPDSLVQISGEYDEEELTINFENYVGYATITIKDSAIVPHVVYSGFEAISSPDSVSIGLTTLTSGTYTILIELANGDSYTATLSIL